MNTADKIIDTCVKTSDMSSQVVAQTRDAGCDGIVTQTNNVGSQMEAVEVKEVDVTCDLLIPSDEDEDAASLEEVTCIKCNGSQMNKKGLPCRKCNGRGTLVSKELSAISAMVRQEVRDYCYSSFRKLFTDYLEDKTAEQAAVVHDRVICDGCNVNPIVGIRYKCSVRHDTDFCERCAASNDHAKYPLLKIRFPRQAPHRIICQFKNSAYQVEPVMAQPAPMRRSTVSEKAKPVRYSARFVRESFSDKHEIMAGDQFCKSWWLRNDGETAWPVGTTLVQTSGDDIRAPLVTVNVEVPAGATYEFQVECKAPATTGKYTAFFRLQTGRIKFGHKVWCDILVVP